MPNRKSDSEVIRELKEMGYTLLGQYSRDKARRVIIQDREGYKFDIGLASFIFNNSKLSIVSIYNPFSLDYNIPLWIKNNNKTFELAEGNIYTGNTCELKFYCHECNEYFYSTWNIIGGGRGCGVCAGKQVPERKSLAYLNPELAREWSDENEISAFDVTLYSSRVVEWICSTCGHVWKAKIADRVYGVGCPACAGIIPTKYNNLAIAFPEILDEWDYDANNVSPENYLPHSDKTAFWICPNCDHHYEASIGDRTKGEGCPACAGKVVTDWNNLSAKFPHLIDEWDFDRNKFPPESFLPYSSKRAFWKCPVCDYKWDAVISSRTGGNRGCPSCKASRGEKLISRILSGFNMVKGEDFIIQAVFNDCKIKRVMPFDFYLPYYNLCIEYHGEQHYEAVEFFGGDKAFKELQHRDKVKREYCYNNGINLLVIPYWEFDNIEQILYDTLTSLQEGGQN